MQPGRPPEHASPQPTEHTTSAKTTPQREEQEVIYVAVHNNIQRWSIILTLIKFNPAPSPFHFCISCCTHTPKTWGQLWKRDHIQHNYGNGLPFFPITPPHPHPTPIHPFCLSLSDCESISCSLKTCQMCSDQCNGLRVHYIHSAPFYEVTSWRGLPAGALCRTVNQAWQRWGGEGRVEEEMDGWRGMEVSPSSTLCLVSQEEMHCGGENTHLRIDTLCSKAKHTVCADRRTHTHHRDACLLRLATHKSVVLNMGCRRLQGCSRVFPVHPIKMRINIILIVLFQGNPQEMSMQAV